MRIVLVVAAVAVCLTVPSAASACSWPTKSDLDTLNVAFPDEAATYWVTRYTGASRARRS